MNFFDLILLPFKWIVSAVLWVFHELFTLIGADPTSGLTWVLSIIGILLIGVMGALLPEDIQRMNAAKNLLVLIVNVVAAGVNRADTLQRRGHYPPPKGVTDIIGLEVAENLAAKGVKVSVMASGMGQPSASIYATELFSFYGVERIIRVGTAGGLSSKVKMGDVVIAIGAHTDSVINTTLCPGIQFSATASWNLLKAAVDAAGDDADVKVAPVVSRDRFYGTSMDQNKRLAELGTLGVEMEAAALYGIAAQACVANTTILRLPGLCA